MNSSVRGSGSQSRRLANEFVNEWQAHNTEAICATRDVGMSPPPHPDEAYTIANYTPETERSEAIKKALSVSDELIDELIISDRLVFAVPMYNFSIPSTFKAYIDNLVRVGRTFGVTEDGGFTGLLKHKKVLVITTSGAIYGEGSPIAHLDHQEPYLRTVLGFMGLEDIHFVRADGLDFSEKEYRDTSLNEAQTQLRDLATTW